MKIQLPCFAEKFVSGNFGNGYATYAKIDGKWYSVNGSLRTREVFEIRWEAKENEINQFLSK